MASEAAHIGEKAWISCIIERARGESTVEANGPQRLRALMESIQDLPDRERLILSLRYDDELTLREIGVVLGLGEIEVARLHTNAMLRIRNKLEQ